MTTSRNKYYPLIAAKRFVRDIDRLRKQGFEIPKHIDRSATRIYFILRESGEWDCIPEPMIETNWSKKPGGKK